MPRCWPKRAGAVGRAAGAGGGAARRQGRSARGARSACAPITRRRDALLRESGPVGRQLDFLCQEFNREANTLCAKSADIDLTRVGLDLKATSRAGARAGAEHRVNDTDATADPVERRCRRDRAARPDAGAVVAVRRRQVDDLRAPCWRGDARAVDVGVGDDPAAATGRGRRPRLSLHRRGERSTRMVAAGELLEHATVFGNSYGTPRGPVEAAAEPTAATCCSTSIGRARSSSARTPRADLVTRLHPAAVARRAGTAAARPRPGQRRRGAAPHGEGRRRDEPLGRVRLHHRQSAIDETRRQGCRRSWPPSGCAASARSASIDFVAAISRT